MLEWHYLLYSVVFEHWELLTRVDGFGGWSLNLEWVQWVSAETGLDERFLALLVKNLAIVYYRQDLDGD